MSGKAYLKHPFEVDQFDGSEEMIDKYAHPVPKGLSAPDGLWMLNDELRQFRVGDWLVTDRDGLTIVVPDNEFQQQYGELPVLPKYVAAYLKVSKNSKVTLFCAIYEAPERVTNHLEATLKYISYHSETFARAWLDGYQVEDGK